MRRALRAVSRRLRLDSVDTPVLAVLALTVLSLFARLVALGERIAHFDEGRVAYWALHYLETGSISYRYIVHGPFVQYVDAALFGLFGPSDVVARLPLAVFGGLLPLAALLFREHLRDGELVALAVFLSFNPVLLYYSRFLRSTLLVAGFAFVAFGFLVRAFDTRRVGYLYAASVALALAFVSKENAVVYLLVWAGASVLLVDHVLFIPHGDTTGREILRRHWRRTVLRSRAAGPRSVATYAAHALGVTGVFLLVALFFLAPRAPGQAIGFWSAVADPTTLPRVVALTVDDVVTGYDYWFGGATEPGCHKETLVAAYGCFLGQFLGTLRFGAAPLSVLAVAGFLVERYVEPRPRYLVLFAAYWGFVSVLGYPLGTDIYGAWITINAIVPLSIPAAVGLARVSQTGWRAFRSGSRPVAALTAVALVLLAVQTGVAASVAYRSPDGGNDALVQYAQPTDDFRDAVTRAADETAHQEVLVYGDTLVNRQADSPIPPACGDMRTLLPLNWYLATNDAQTVCATDRAALETAMDGDGPDLVVAASADAVPLRSRLDGYDERRYAFRTGGRTTVFFVRTEPSSV